MSQPNPIRDRIRDFRRVKASQLHPHPNNWRKHPQAQADAMRGMLAEIGYADALLARELPDGSLQLIDGHLRADITPDMEVPVLVLDLDDQEAAKLLALHDPLAELAQANDNALADLLAGVDTDNAPLNALLAQMSDRLARPARTKLHPIPTRKPPKLTWVLIGIPTVRFDEIAQAVHSLARVDDIIIESTSNDGRKNR